MCLIVTKKHALLRTEMLRPTDWQHYLRSVGLIVANLLVQHQEMVLSKLDVLL